MTKHDEHAGGRDAGQYAQIRRAIAETPWAVLPATLATILDVVEYRAAGNHLSDDEIRARIGSGPSSRPTYTQGAVAVLPLYGVIIPKANLMSEMSGGTSVQRFSAAFKQAVDDPDVDAILIDVDSPGGSVFLVEELAAEIYAARGRKPVTAIASPVAASAAYWIAAQADELVVTPSGAVGSIGVFAAHTDISQMQEMAGVKTTLVSAGEFKTERSPFAPLSAEAEAALQKDVDETYGKFVAAVAAGRGVSEKVVLEDFGQGRMVSADRALSLGMVDRIDTFQATLARLARGSAPSGPRAAADASATTGGRKVEIEIVGDAAAIAAAVAEGLSFSDEVERARTHVSALVARAQSLAELRRSSGRAMSASSRAQLGDLVATLRESTTAIDALLAVNDPNAEALLREVARFERRRSSTT